MDRQGSPSRSSTNARATSPYSPAPRTTSPFSPVPRTTGTFSPQPRSTSPYSPATGSGRATSPFSPGLSSPARTPDEIEDDQAALLMWSLSAWHKDHADKNAGVAGRTRRKIRRMRTVKAQEDEKSLCHSDWAGDLSVDQPSYGSVFLQLKEANQETEGSCEFLRKTTEIVSSTIFLMILLGAFMILPVGMISVGVKYLNECPKEPKIPIYLLVGGCFGLLKLLSMLWKQVRNRRYERLDEIYEPDEENGDVIMSKSSRFTEIVLSLFLFVWFVLGNYWVLGIWRPNFTQLLHAPSDWCDRTVYMFAFIQIMICYGLMGLIALLICILSICHKCTGDQS